MSPIIEISGLQILDLSNNSLSILPNDAGKLTLSGLDISHNNLTHVPDGFLTLPLQNLSLAYNGLEKLPDGIVALPNLALLNISHNKLSTLPANFTNLSLYVLDMSYNNISGNVSQLVNIVLKSSSKCDVSYNYYKLDCPVSFSLCCLDYNASPPPSQGGNCSDYTCICSSNLNAILGTYCYEGQWIIDGNATNNGTIVVGGQDTVVIGGDFIQTDQGTLQIHTNPNLTSGGNIQVAGQAQLGGTLVIIITGKLTNQTLLPIINASNVSGNFTSIQVVSQFQGSKCYNTKAQAIYTANTMGTLLTQTKNGKCNNNDTKRTIAIAVGCAGGAVMIMIIVAIIVLLYLRQRGKLVWLFWSKPTGTHGRDRLGSRADQKSTSSTLLQPLSN